LIIKHASYGDSTWQKTPGLYSVRVTLPGREGVSGYDRNRKTVQVIGTVTGEGASSLKERVKLSVGGVQG
jgi:hypothetical protein